MPETLRDVICALPCDGATTLAFLGALPVALLDATVYRSCPRCGGAKEYWVKDGAAEFPEPCDCVDAPTAIVEVALREKAIDAVAGVIAEYDTCGEKTCPGADEPATLHIPVPFDFTQEVLDAVLSVVLGQVRYAEEVGRVVQLNGPVVVQADGDPDSAGLLGAGTLIAILEEAGKEGDK